MANDDIARILKILKSAESTLESALIYARRASQEDPSGQARRAVNEIESAISEIGTAIRKLKSANK
jgi:phosphoglycerate-specific signal transduction histidine kinase